MFYKLNIRPMLTQFIEIPIAKIMHKCGLKPNHITMASLVLCIFSSYMIISNNFIVAGLIFFFGSCLDLFDGTLSRLTQTSSEFGALLDSIGDRVGESFILSAIIILPIVNSIPNEFLLNNPISYLSIDNQIHMSLVPLGLIGLIASQLVSYTRARGESLGVRTESGIMSRAERVILLSIGLVTGYIWVSTALVAIFSTITLFQRIYLISIRVSTVVNTDTRE